MELPLSSDGVSEKASVELKAEEFLKVTTFVAKNGSFDNTWPFQSETYTMAYEVDKETFKPSCSVFASEAVKPTAYWGDPTVICNGFKSFTIKLRRGPGDILNLSAGRTIDGATITYGTETQTVQVKWPLVPI